MILLEKILLRRSKIIGIIKLRSTPQKVQVRIKLKLLLLVIAIAANKGDLYEHEEVDEGVGRAFAKDIGAIFRYTSAKNASGIDELFKAIGSKLIDPNYEEGGKVEADPEHDKIRSQTIKLNQKSGGKNGNNKEKCGC